MKIFDSLRDIARIRKFVSSQLFFEAARSEFRFKISNDVGKAKVLVLSPHPDDDVFGCGGAIKMSTNKKNPVKVIYLTEKKGVASRRETEAQAACKILGVSDFEFWRYPEGSLGANRSLIKRLRQTIEKFQPTLIYLPSFLDLASDHQETAKAFAQAIKEVDLPLFEIFSYEVWNPITPNRILVIDKAISSKISAIKKHKSQLLDRDYLNAMLGLASYRGLIFGAGNHAESFFACNKKLYLDLIKLSGLA